MIQIEETRSQAAVSESVMTRVGGGINFINTAHVYQHSWKLNGFYNVGGAPNLALDGYITYPYAFEIVDVFLFNGSVIGSSGTTEVDVKWKPELSGAYQSIFSTTPKADSTSAAFGHIRIGQTATGFTAAVLDKSTFDPYDVLRFDLLQAMAGDPEGLELKTWIRPISP